MWSFSLHRRFECTLFVRALLLLLSFLIKNISTCFHAPVWALSHPLDISSSAFSTQKKNTLNRLLVPNISFPLWFPFQFQFSCNYSHSPVFKSNTILSIENNQFEYSRANESFISLLITRWVNILFAMAQSKYMHTHRVHTHTLRLTERNRFVFFLLCVSFIYSVDGCRFFFYFISLFSL